MGPVGSPCCKNDQKCLCLKSQGIGDLGPVAGDEGLCVSNAKSMCLVQAFQIIPTKPFIECCGKRVWGAPKPGGDAPAAGGNFGSPETLESCQRDLAEAVANEDYLLANVLKQRRTKLMSQMQESVPAAIQMA